ncbi:MAG: undecaprenyl-diphosphate phosphatase [Acidimicrobiales bacterium]
MPDLSTLDAIILGLVEGLTEYLPVSSTGHLLVTNEFLGLVDTPEAEKASDTFAICIQAGAILAVVVLYWERIRQMLDGLLGRSAEGRRVLSAVLVAFLPTVIIGLTLKDIVRERLFGVGPIAVAWVAGGLVILWLQRSGWFDQTRDELGALTMRKAAIIGALQAVALWPGVSRSMTVIIAGVLVGLSLRAAVEFSFLLGLLTLTAATALSFLEDGQEMIDTFGVLNPLIGLAVAFLSALAAVKWMVAWLNEKGFEVFGWYRLLVGGAAFVLIGSNVLSWS